MIFDAAYLNKKMHILHPDRFLSIGTQDLTTTAGETCSKVQYLLWSIDVYSKQSNLSWFMMFAIS